MDIGVVVPQGFASEFGSLGAKAAWERSLALATAADRLGFESIWLFDHLYPEASDQGIVFEGFTMLAGLATRTRRVRIGHLVACAGYRNPALVAKMISTIDVMSDGRAELGLGAGWHRAEHEAYGYGFPSLRERQSRLADSLEIARRMLEPGRATYAGPTAHVRDAVNEPRGLRRPRIPIIVGGNGQRVTWRLAARLADELNLDGPDPGQVRAWLPIIAARCEQEDRDPDDLRVSVFMWWGNAPGPGRERADRLAAYREAGVARVMVWPERAVESDEALPALAEDATAAGLTLCP